jgi:hypothetical protein
MTATTSSIRRWPYVTATVIGIVVWFAWTFILSAIAPGAWAVTGFLGYGVGVVAGTLVSGLKGPQGWAVSPVITLCVGILLFGTLALLGVHLPP